MVHFTRQQIFELNKIKRLNLINSISGVKPANLIGTKSADGKENIAIFSSVFHLGSNPPQIGFIMRPSDDVPRNTFTNILETKYYTINHIHSDFVENAHYTSAKFDASISEFEECRLEATYLVDFHAPFVKASKLKYGMKLVECIPIPSSNTTLVVGIVEHLFIDEQGLDEQGVIDLEKMDVAGISGLNVYYSLNKIGEFPYARVEELPDFKVF
jgi:flavin reductase (DIM6/NTAB) family NADH-FMN oxidoreductase RutF